MLTVAMYGLNTGWQRGRTMRAPGSASYCIRPGYISRAVPAYFRDDEATRDGLVWQPDVYPAAARLATRLGARRIADIGCGRGDKLAALHPRFEIVGIDIGPNIAHCRARYPHGTWLEHNLDTPSPLPLGPEQLDGTVIVCADVIEHLTRPDYLLNNLYAALQQAAALVISTPERDLFSGFGDLGPPRNPAHTREWTIQEFTRLLRRTGFATGRVSLTRCDRAPVPRRGDLGMVERTPKVAPSHVLAVPPQPPPPPRRRSTAPD